MLLVAAPSSVAAAPPNDECAAATRIKSLPFTRTLAVDGASGLFRTTLP